MPKISGYVKIFKVKDEDKDENNKLMSLHINDEKLLEKYKNIWTKIEDSKNIELNTLTVYDDRQRNAKIRIYRDKVYTNFYDSNVPEDDMEWESFTFVPTDSLLL